MSTDTVVPKFGGRAQWGFRLLGACVALGLFLAGMWMVPLAIFGPDRAFIPGDLGDARFNNYILEHFHQFIMGRVDGYWDAPFMYPWKNVIALSDNLLGTAPIYSALRTLGQTREGAFQGWILALFALNFWCCLLALRKWAGNTVLAACGAYIFAFGIYNIGQMNNLQVLPRFMVPLAFMFLWNHLQTGSWKWLTLAVLATVYQFYCGIYIGFILVYALFFLFIGHLIIFRKPSFLRNFREWRFTATWVAAAVAGLLLLMPMMLQYMAVPEKLGNRQYADIAASIPRPSSYFFAHPAALSWRSLSRVGWEAFPQWWSHFHFLGALPWLAVITVPFLLFNKRRPTAERRVLAAIGLALVLSTVFCLNIGEFSLYRLVFMLPGFSVLRAIDRFIDVQVVFFLIVFVLVLRPLFQRPKVAWALSLLLPMLVVQDNRWAVEHTKRFDKHVSQQLVAEVERRITRAYHPGPDVEAIAYEPILPVLKDFEEHHTLTINAQLDAMLAGQALGVHVVNGYSGGYPGNYLSFFDNMDHRTLADWCAFNNRSTEGIQEINGLAVPVISRDTVRLIAASGKYLCADQSREERMLANRDKADDWETFQRLHLPDGRVALLASNGKFVCAELEREDQVMATGDDLGDFGLFTMEQLDSGLVTLKAFNGKYVELDPATEELHAKADVVGPNAWFRIVKP
ncbi:MAG: hypothetical protein JST38_05000 [Bacteroidetes bacterium]|nr:hypothetical protein [Bacteroidota bacterium]